MVCNGLKTNPPKIIISEKEKASPVLHTKVFIAHNYDKVNNENNGIYNSLLVV